MNYGLVEENVVSIFIFKVNDKGTRTESVPHPDVFWAYRFLEVEDWIV